MATCEARDGGSKAGFNVARSFRRVLVSTVEVKQNACAGGSAGPPCATEWGAGHCFGHRQVGPTPVATPGACRHLAEGCAHAGATPTRAPRVRSAHAYHPLVALAFCTPAASPNPWVTFRTYALGSLYLLKVGPTWGFGRVPRVIVCLFGRATVCECRKMCARSPHRFEGGISGSF